MLLSLLQPEGLCISIPFTGLLLLSSFRAYILLTIQISAKTSLPLWPFPVICPGVSPGVLTRSVSVILFPIFLSYLFPAIIWNYMLLFFFFVFLSIAFLSSHICSMRTETLLGLFILCSAPTMQLCP